MASLHGIILNGQRYLFEPLLYAVCNNNPTENKAIDIPYFELRTGVTIHVLFVNTNTRQNPTLMINSGTAAPIYMDTLTPIGTTPELSWTAGSMVNLTYDGNKWIIDANGNRYFKIKQDPVDDPTISDDGIAAHYGLQFIDSISQNANGEITVSKKNVQIATETQNGILTNTEQHIGGLKHFHSGVEVKVERVVDDKFILAHYTVNDVKDQEMSISASNIQVFNVDSESNTTPGLLQIQPLGGGLFIGASQHAVTGILYGTYTIATDNGLIYSGLQTIAEDTDTEYNLWMSPASHIPVQSLRLFYKPTEGLMVENNIVPVRTIQNYTITDYTLGTPTSLWSALYVGSTPSYGGTTQPIWWNNGVPTPLIFEPNRLYYSAAGNSFDYTLHYADTTKVAINWVTEPADNFYVYGTTKLEYGVGIGISPETPSVGVNTDYHILSILGSTIIYGTDNIVAHLDTVVDSGDDVLRFVPGIANSGYIGLKALRWKEGHFANQITVGDGFDARYTGELILKNTAPRIYLQTTAANKASWEIKNTGGRFSIFNGNNIGYYGTDYGFELTGKLFINGQILSTSTLDFYVHGTTELFGHVGIGNTPDQAHDLAVNGLTHLEGNVGIGAAAQTGNSSHKLYVNGSTYFNGPVNFNGNILPGAHQEYNIGSSTLAWNNISARAMSIRYIDAAEATRYSDSILCIGYGDMAPTAETRIYYSASTSNRTEHFTVNVNGPYAPVRLGIKGQNPNYDLYVNGTSCFTANGYLGGLMYIGLNGAGGYINGLTPSNGATNSILLGDDTWIGEANINGLLAIRPSKSSTNISGITVRDYSNNEMGRFYAQGGIFKSSLGIETNGNIHANTGLILSTSQNNTLTMGSQTSDYANFNNSKNIPFLFNKSVQSLVEFRINNTQSYMNSTGFHPPVGGGIYWNPNVESSSDATDVTQIYQKTSGAAGGTELCISQANDNNDIINLVSPAYIYLNSKRVFTINDTWLRINEDSGYSSGIYTGSSLIRTDNQLQVGAAGDAFKALSTGNTYIKTHLGVAYENTNYGISTTKLITQNEVYGTTGLYTDGNLNMSYNGSWWPAVQNFKNGNIGLNAAGKGAYIGYSNTTNIYLYTSTTCKLWVDANTTYVSSRYSDAENTSSNCGLVVREVKEVGSAQSSLAYAPKIGFYWNNRTSSYIALQSTGWFKFGGANSVYTSIDAGIYKAHSGKGTVGADETGAALLCPSIASNTGIFNGSADSSGMTLGTSGSADLIIKSWYSIGIVDGCTSTKKGMTVGINARTGDIKMQGNLYVSAANTTGGGIYLSDDGSIVDNNDGYCSARFTYGLRVTAGKDTNGARVQLRNTGVIDLWPQTGNYSEGIRIHQYSNWATITLCGNDNTGDAGTSTKTWSIHNNDGSFYIARNGSSSSNSAILTGKDKEWTLSTNGAWKFTMDSNHIRLCSRYASADPYSGSAIEIREVGEVQTAQSAESYAPKVGFHWGGRTSAYLALLQDGTFKFGHGSTYYGVRTGLLYVTANSNTVTFGSQNSSWCHIYNSANIPFIFNNTVATTGGNLGTSSYPWSNLIIAAGGRVNGNGGALYIGNYNDDNWVYISDCCSRQGSDKWKIYSSGAMTFSSGTIVGSLTVNSGNTTGAGLILSDDGDIVDNNNGFCSMRFTSGVIITNGNKTNTEKIRLGSDGVVTASRGIFSSGTDAAAGSVNGVALITGNPNGQHIEQDDNEIIAKSSASAKSTLYLNENGYVAADGKIYNAVWNDFAEYRQSDVTEAGRVVASDGHGKVILTTKRLQPSSHVISDTFGMGVGESDIAKTPLGVSGRVLVYPYRNRAEYKVGDCLCAAPNGTADIMTREEVIQYPDRIIGIVDEVPNYEVWQQTFTTSKRMNQMEVPIKGRIWIYVR